MLSKNKKSICLVFLCLGLLVEVCAATQVKNLLTSYDERLGYAFGANIGREMRKLAPRIDLDSFLRAVEDVFHGNEFWLSVREVRHLKKEFATFENGEKEAHTKKTSGADLPSIDTKKLGYAFGVDFGGHLYKLNSKVNLEFVIVGIRDQYVNAQSLLSREEEKSLLKKFSLKQKQEKLSVIRGKNLREGINFLARNRSEPGVITTKNGLQYKVIIEGKGIKPSKVDNVKVSLRGTLLDGTEFVASPESAIVQLDKTIAGLREGLMLMSEGSKYRLFIPDRLAYSYKGFSDKIGPYAVLIYDVELISVQGSH